MLTSACQPAIGTKPTARLPTARIHSASESVRKTADRKEKKGMRTIGSVIDRRDWVESKPMLRHCQNTRTAQTKAIIVFFFLFCEWYLALVCFCIMLLSVPVSFVFLISLIFFLYKRYEIHV